MACLCRWGNKFLTNLRAILQKAFHLCSKNKRFSETILKVKPQKSEKARGLIAFQEICGFANISVRKLIGIKSVVKPYGKAIGTVAADKKTFVKFVKWLEVAKIIETLFIPAMALFSLFHYSRWCEGEVIYHWFQGLLRLAQTILQCHSCCWKTTICWFKAAVCLDTFQRKRTRCCIKEDTAAYFTISSFLLWGLLLSHPSWFRSSGA